jgi:hypothetical protein
MREPYPRPRAEATLGVPAHLRPVVGEIAKRLRLKPGWPAQITSGLTFQDREGGNYVVSLDDAGWHVALGWRGAADTASAFRRAIEEQAAGPNPLRCSYCGVPVHPTEGCLDPICRAEGYEDAAEGLR